MQRYGTEDAGGTWTKEENEAEEEEEEGEE